MSIQAAACLTAYRPKGAQNYLFAHGEPGAKLIAAKAEVECRINSLWAAVEADAYARMA